MKGWQRLDAEELAVLRELAAWRERAARRANIRPNFIANDVVLVTLAGRPLEDVEELRGVRGLSAGTVDRHGRNIVAAIRAGRECPAGRGRRRRSARPAPGAADAAWSRCCGRRCRRSPIATSSRRRSSPARATSTRWWPARRRKAGAESEQGEPALLQGWRRDLVGDTLLSIARGELAMRYDPARREVVGEPQRR